MPDDFQVDTSKPWTQADLELLGIRPASEGGILFCGVELQEYAIGGVTHQWPRGSHLLWQLEFSRLGPLSASDVKDAWAVCCKEYSDCCDLTFDQARPGQVPNLVIVTRRLDGSSGILADCQIPVGNVGPGTTLTMRIDDSENWGLIENPPRGMIDLYRVLGHEGQHWLGCGHKPANVTDAARIAPTYDTRIRYMQDADKSELVRRYGQPKQVPGPGPKPSPVAPMMLPIEVSVEAFGHRYTAKGNVKR